jgi:hypothetical protein
MAVYFRNMNEHVNKLGSKLTESLHVAVNRTYFHHWTLKAGMNNNELK